MVRRSSGLIPFAQGVAANEDDPLRIAAVDSASQRGALASHHPVERRVVHARLIAGIAIPHHAANPTGFAGAAGSGCG